MVVLSVPCDDVGSMGEEGFVAFLSGGVFGAFSIGMDGDLVDCGVDVVLGECGLCVLCDGVGVVLELVVDDDCVEVVVFLFHGVCECE